ncbi:MAG TPA: hypothetical protein DDZ80_17730 [Cyanobacteria bacterium UBA8803]|nr:hypothetical protein [Cyanobacteria bacterium UBA9273]HBL60226.1 hypothetical protein [Cyanobacteria bacterium UBA8803]
MLAPIRYILSNQLKCKYLKLPQKISGFTLIELLVAMILAVLVISPLVGFAINILDTDRKEQAKATSEQEIKDALDYIAQDLKQAVYIYDNDGLSQDHNPSPTLQGNGNINSGIKNQIPPVAGNSPNCLPADTATCRPILVFWKRELIPSAIPVAGSGSNDTFVYSLVGYYLITTPNPTWSNTARIGRFEIKNAVPNAANPNQPLVAGSPGFAGFDRSLPGTLKQKMHRWTKSGDFTTQTTILVDYIDHTPQNTPGVPAVTNTSCQSVSTNAQLIPPNNPNGIYSFYACVDSSQNLARIYLRGNALARIQKNNNTYKTRLSTFFPSANIIVKTGGFLSPQ